MDGAQVTHRGQPAAAHYAPADNSYATRLVHEDSREETPSGGTKRAECFIAYLFGANLVLSILNTLLLSFIIKTTFPLQDGPHDAFLSSKFVRWREQLGQVELDLPLRLALGRSLRVETLSAHQDGPLIIEGGSQPVPSIAQQQADDESLLIGAGPASPFKSGGQQKPGRNFILINRGGTINQDRLIESDADNERPPPVEIVTRSLTLGAVSKQSRPAESHQHTRAHQARQPTAGALDQQQHPTRRWLHYDGEQQALSVYVNQLDGGLFADGKRRPTPATTKFLVLSERLQSSVETLGSIESNFDVQTRRGNLSCRGGESLRLVSRLGKLRLLPAERLALVSPTINLEAANRLLISNGISYLESIQPAEEADRRASPAGDESNLNAHTLLLVDGKLAAGGAA